MNTDLLLRTASRIEAQPDHYDQSTGLKPLQACVAGTALLVEDPDYPTGFAWDEISYNARVRLGLDPQQAYALFAPYPTSANLAAAFPLVRDVELEAIEELSHWTFNDDGELVFNRTIAGGGEVTFDQFWLAPRRPRLTWRRAAARVMAATLRLIARTYAKAAQAREHEES